MAKKHSVIYTGSLQPGVELEQAVAAFSARFHVEKDKVRRMLESGGGVAIQAGLTAAQAREYRSILQRIGLTVRIDPPVDDLSAARRAHRRDGAYGPGELHEPRSVPAGHGWLWLRRGFSMVFAYPAHWIGALLIWSVLNFFLNLVPIVNVLSALVAAVFMGGVMLGAYEQDTGQGFSIERLFAGFSSNFGALFLVGIVYMIGFITIVLVTALTFGGLAAAVGDLYVPGPDVPVEAVFSPLVWLPVLLVFALVIPLLMAYWFAPALVMLDDVPPFHSMALSFLACLKNIVPFVVYGLITIVLFILGTIPLLLGLLIIMPAVVASVYTAYCDIFRWQ